jgi:hypothetical protein
MAFPEDLGQQLLLGGEVPVEDPLAHAHALHDLGHGGGVEAVLGESVRGEVHELTPPIAAPLR